MSVYFAVEGNHHPFDGLNCSVRLRNLCQCHSQEPSQERLPSYSVKIQVGSNHDLVDGRKLSEDV